MSGELREALRREDQEHAFETYCARFEGLRAIAHDYFELTSKVESRFFVLLVQRIKILDEPTFGRDTWIEAQLE